MASRRSGRAEASPESYDAFISYSHAADGKLAPALQQGLQRLAKPWYRRRALRVFRDKTSLSASPELWPAIESALSQSRTFVLLASPDSAASTWVNEEVAWWRENRDPSRFLIAVTGGDLVWDDAANDFPAGAPVPPALRGFFPSEPLWVDLRFANTAVQVSHRDPRFRDAIADLAAPIHGRPKDELVGDDVVQHRRALRLAWGAALALLLLTIATAVGAVIAVGQRNTAREQSAIATAREIAATAVATLPSRLDIANGLAAEGYMRRRTPQTEASLLAAIATSPHLVRFSENGSPVRALAPVPGRNLVFLGDERGRVRTWHGATGRFADLPLRADGPVTTLAVSDGGERVAVADEGGVVRVLDVESGDVASFEGDGVVRAIGLHDTSRWVVVDSVGGDTENDLTVLDLETGQAAATKRVQSGGAQAIRISTQATSVRMLNAGGTVESYALPGLEQTGSAGDDFGVYPVGGFISAVTADARYLGFYKSGVTVFDSATLQQRKEFPVDTQTDASALAIAPEAERVAVASSGTIHVADPRDPDTTDGGGLVADPLSGLAPRIELLTFVGGSDRLVSVSGDLLVAWDLEQPSRLAERLEADLDDGTTAEIPAGLSVVGDGGQVAWAGEGNRVGITDARTGKAARRTDAAGDVTLYTGFVVEPGGASMIAASGNALTRVTLDGGASEPLTMPEGAPETDPALERILRRGEEALGVFGDGSVYAVAPGASEARRVAGAVGSMPPEGWYLTDTAVAARTGDVLTAVTGRLWHLDPASGRRTPWPRRGGEVVGAVATSPDGKVVVTDDGLGAVHVWEDRRVVRTIDTGPVLRLEISPDGRYVVTIANDGTLSVWSRATGSRLGATRLLANDTFDVSAVGPQTVMEFAPDGTLFTASVGGSLLRWDLSPETWLRTACKTAGHALTEAEWKRYLSIPFEPAHRCS